MILTRSGNKRRIAKLILPHFPAHKIFIDLFFGAGGIFFSKPPAQYNFLNDKDEEVYNLFNVIRHQAAELEAALRITPQHNSLFQFWRKAQETDPVWKAARFLMLSNMGYMGKPDMLRMSYGNTWGDTIARINEVADRLRTTRFMCADFEKALNSIAYREELDKGRAFIYADPPYLTTRHTYQNGFTIDDTARLFRVLNESGIRFAVSEFDNPVVREIAAQYDLNVIEIGERQNLKSRRIELLFTNYESPAVKVIADRPAALFSYA